MSQPSHRIYTFDLLRGIAVMTMIAAHSVYFFYNRQSGFLLGVEGFGNVVSFVTFLLVSGAVASVAYFGGHRSTQPIKRGRVFTRVLLLLLAYYLLALVLTSSELLRAEGFARLRVVLNILSFRYLPSFTEYFPPFIFYSALLALMPRLFLVASRKLWAVIVTSAMAFTAGWFLYHVPVGIFFKPWISLVAGAPGLFRFPLLQYLPVFLLGLYWGHRTLADEGLRRKRVLSAQLFGFFGLIAAGAWLGTHFLGWPIDTTFSRWPPSIPFLALGLGFAFLAVLLLYTVRQFRRLPLVRDLLLMFGQNALGLFWSHIFLLGLYAAAGGSHVSSLLVFIFLWLLLILLSVALTTFLPFNFRLALTSNRGSHEEHEEALEQEAVFRLSQDVAAEATITTTGLKNYFFPGSKTSKRVLKKRHKLGISLAVFGIAAIVFPSSVQEIALQQQQRDAALWWSNAYAYRQQVTLQNTQSFITLPKDTPVTMQFNHKQLVDEGKSRADGLDLKLVYWTGQAHIVMDSQVENPASQQATLKFRLPVQMEGGKQEDFYYLYYGGFVDPPPHAITLKTDQSVKATFGDEETYPLVASVSTTWNLIGQPDSDTISFHLATTDQTESQTATYQILGTTISGPMVPSPDASWEALVPVDTLSPGAYQIQATLHDGTRDVASQLTGFYRSYPLYVAWTIDWEGYDTNQAYLDAMEAIANQYHLPMTHFFNPRIYVTKSISPQRAQSLTQWVKRRLTFGDGYGLHLHMFTDFVGQAGVTPRLEPNWGDNGSGYGVPFSAYTKDEQEKLLQNALDLLVANGFGKTDLFRAGGWYDNLDSLAALENLGFQADSSARTAYQFGRNRLPGFWDIRATTRPYYPSRTNQNKSSGTDDFSVLEIPDNGADSYAFSAEQMIDRFTDNIGNGILSEKQQLTYLSHPHWFDEKEQARVRQLFSVVSRYTFSNDQGPVIFTTTKAIANIWTSHE